MAQIKRLTNQTRAAQRPPFVSRTLTAGMLDKIFPGVQRQARKSFDSPPRGTPPKAITPPVNPQQSAAKPVPAQPVPRAPSLRPPGTGGSSVEPASPPIRNGAGKNGAPRHSQLFNPEHYAPARTSRPAADRLVPRTAPAAAPGDDPGNAPAGKVTGAGEKPAGSPSAGAPPAGAAPAEKPPAREASSGVPTANRAPAGSPLPARSQRPVEKLPAPPAGENQPPASEKQPSAVEKNPPGVEKKPPAGGKRLPADLSAGLRRLYQQHDDLPEQGAVLGVGGDNFPVVLDLNDPQPGALVVIGDEREAQLDLLRSLVTSLAMRGTPRSLQLLFVTVDPAAWQNWITTQGYQRFTLGVVPGEDLDMLREWILRLGDWTEQRRLGQRSGPPVLLVMDTLSFLPRLPYDVRLNFDWMVKEGPAARIWPVAAVSNDLAQSLNSRRMLRAFQTRILGHADDPTFTAQLAGLSEQEAAGFVRPGRFAVRLGENWLEFGLVSQS